MDNQQILYSKMVLFLTHLKSVAELDEPFNIIFDITNNDSIWLRYFRLIVPESYQNFIITLLQSDFPDFNCSVSETIKECDYFLRYNWFIVFRTNTNKPLIKNTNIFSEEYILENLKTLINSVDKGSFQILLEFPDEINQMIWKEELDSIKIDSNTMETNLNYVKDLKISFRFLSFETDFCPTAVPSTVWGILNLKGRSNIISKEFRWWKYITRSWWIKNFIIDLFYRYMHGIEPRLQYFSSADACYFSARELATLYSFIYCDKIDWLPYTFGNPWKVLNKQKELEEIYGDHKQFTRIAQIAHPNYWEEWFKLDIETKRRHVYFLGRTWSGKSTCLIEMMKDDIKNGRWFCLLDPHGDLADKILDSISFERAEDVIYIDPSHPCWRVGLWIFSFLREIRNRHFKSRSTTPSLQEFRSYSSVLVSMMVTALKSISIGGKEQWWPRLDMLIKSIWSELLKYECSEVLDISAYLNSEEFRKSVLANIDDHLLKEELDSLNQKSSRVTDEWFQPLKNRLGIFNVAYFRNIFSGTPKFSLKEAMDSNKILIFRLWSGLLSEEGNLLGSIMVSLIFHLSMSNAWIWEDERHDFTIYADECQRFVTDEFSKILSEARKYRLSLVLANQSLSQLSVKNPETLNAILGNVWTMVSFAVWPEDALIISKRFRLNSEKLANLTPHKAYVSCEPYSDESFLVQTSVGACDETAKYPGRLKVVASSSEKYGLECFTSIKTYTDCILKSSLFYFLKSHNTFTRADCKKRWSYHDKSIDKLLGILDEQWIIKKQTEDLYGANIDTIILLESELRKGDIIQFEYVVEECNEKDPIILRMHFDKYGSLPSFWYRKDEFEHDLLENG